MEIFPAIDLYEGKAVRLVHGDYQQMTVYSEHPEKIAEHFCSCGAKYAHLVDLEGARDGTTPNLQLVEKIASESDLRLEIGGGIRTEEVAKRYLDAGCWRVILGTAAVENPDLLEKLAARFGKRIAVGIDVRGERVAVRGWMSEAFEEGAKLKELYYPGDDFTDEFADSGYTAFRSTDNSMVLGGYFIESDGTERGTSGYPLWVWILWRSSDGGWFVKDAGY